MNTNANRWAVKVKNSLMNEAIQHIAFGFGYSWGRTNSNDISWINASFLIFNPDLKIITWANNELDFSDTVYQIVSTYEDVVYLFNHPPMNSKKIGYFEFKKDGSVSILSDGVFSKDVFDEVVAERAKFLGL